MKDAAAWKPPPNLAYREGVLRILDQTRLPSELCFIEARDLATVLEAITTLRIRGAPALGLAGAYGLAVALADHLRQHPASGPEQAWGALARAGAALTASRPTAVNLSRAIAWVQLRALAGPAAEGSDAGASTAAASARAENSAGPAELLARVEEAALALHAREAEACERIAAAGLGLLPAEASLLTHCNTGPLATGGIGTALGVILRGHEQGRRFSIYVDETRPLLQGARLTAWELQAAGVPCRLIPDSAAASLILGGKVDAVLVGADRVAANGDTANKVGTLPLALAAHRARIPFYVAAPASSIDADCPRGALIPIEERGEAELTHWGGILLTAPGMRAFNPAFDITPADLVTAFITDRGVMLPPYDFSASRMSSP